MREAPAIWDRALVSVGFLAALVLGLSAGAMLTEAVVFVDYWRTLAPPVFLAWFAANEPLLVSFYAPLQVCSALLAIASAMLVRHRPGRVFYWVSAAAAVIALLLYPLYFRDANASFVAGTVPLEDVRAALDEWSAWQWLRTAIGVGGFAAALLGVWSTSAAHRRRSP